MKIYLHTFGCKVNQYETQLLREYFTTLGAELVDNYISADVAVINSCTVTHNADADCRQIIRRILRENDNCRIIVTGCYAIRAPEEITQLGNTVEICKQKESLMPSQFSLPNRISYFHNHRRAFVKIQDGCDAYCSYCIVPFVRYKVCSRPKGEIEQEIATLIENGYKEVVLTGIRLGKYKSNGYVLSDLVAFLLDTFPEIRLEMSSIELKDITPDLIELLSSTNRILPHLHIPLQSGDDSVLRLMNRPYTTDEYFDKINFMRRKIKQLSITTDIMVGFPGETEQCFRNTYEFIKKVIFDKLHIFRYSPRPGTSAVHIEPKNNPADIKLRTKVLLTEFSTNALDNFTYIK